MSQELADQLDPATVTPSGSGVHGHQAQDGGEPATGPETPRQHPPQPRTRNPRRTSNGHADARRELSASLHWPHHVDCAARWRGPDTVSRTCGSHSQLSFRPLSRGQAMAPTDTVISMTLEASATIRVGHVQIPLGTAIKWVRSYTDEVENRSSAEPYAFPAYDRYNALQDDPARISDADLLAPALLNVGSSLRSFYGLQEIRGQLEDALADEDLAKPLASIEDKERIAALVKPLYAVLDDPKTRPWGLQVTTLSKILHRKRPQFLVLHDTWVKSCYLGADKPVVPVTGRSPSDYMVAITRAIGQDIRNQKDLFRKLDESSRCPGELSHVRLIDILAWTSKGNTPVGPEGPNG